MFSSNILEVCIGLIFIYLLLSLLATAVNELILSLLYSARGKFLEKAIVAMLSDRQPAGESPVKVNNPGEGAEADKAGGKDTGQISHSLEPGAAADLAERFYTHPLVITLAKQGKNNKPSYISKATFSRVLIDLLSLPETAETTVAEVRAAVLNLPDNKTRALLLSLIRDAGNDIAQLRTAFETWYEEMMDRTSGWYKRRVQWIILLIGFLMSAVLNADTVHIAKVLSQDPEARVKLITQTQAFLEQNGSTVTVRTAETKALASQINYLLKDEIAEAGTVLGMGWTKEQREAVFSSGYKGFGNVFTKYIMPGICGWFITAVAITLGAPFWFDLLNKVVNIRNVGKKPEEKVPLNKP